MQIGYVICEQKREWNVNININVNRDLYFGLIFCLTVLFVAFFFRGINLVIVFHFLLSIFLSIET